MTSELKPHLLAGICWRKIHCSEREVNGTIKWFKTQSGFGFASPSDGGNDIFVHRSALSRSNLMPEDMQPGTNIRMMVRQAEKGLEAVQVSIAG